MRRQSQPPQQRPQQPPQLQPIPAQPPPQQHTQQRTQRSQRQQYQPQQQAPHYRYQYQPHQQNHASYQHRQPHQQHHLQQPQYHQQQQQQHHAHYPHPNHVHNNHNHPHPRPPPHLHPQSYSHLPQYGYLSTSIPPRSAQLQRPPKPQPQKSSSMPASMTLAQQSQQSPQLRKWESIKFSLNKNNNNNNNKKRSFMDMIDDNNNENIPVNNNDKNNRKRRKIKEQHSFIEQCSIPYQSLIDPNKWKKKQFLNKKTKAMQKIAKTIQPIQSLNNQKNGKNENETEHKKPKIIKKKQKASLDYAYYYNLLIDGRNNNKLFNSDQLIYEWDNILSGLSFEIMRHMAISELRTELQQQIKDKKEREKFFQILINKKNKYFTHHPNGTIGHYDIKHFKNRHLYKFNSNLCDKKQTFYRINSLFSYISFDDTSMVNNDCLKYNALTLNNTNHRIFLWPNGFSYFSMDNFYSYCDNENMNNFISLIDQSLIPTVWCNQIKRDSFNKKFFKEHQTMRYNRFKNKQKFKNKMDDNIIINHNNITNNDMHKKKDNSTANLPPYFEGHLLLELIDFRYVCNDNLINSYKYKQNTETQRILLNGNGYSIDLSDIPRYHLNNFKMKHFEWIKILHQKQNDSYVLLSKKYAFYNAFKLEMVHKYQQLVQKVNEKEYEMKNLYNMYMNYRATNSFNYSHTFNWIKKQKERKRFQNELLQQYYLCIINNEQMYQNQCKQLKNYKANIEKKQLEFEKNKNNPKNNQNQQKHEYLTIIQRDQTRLTKFVSSNIIKNEIEKGILLRLYPDLCLNASIKVMQVLNYCHYVSKQNIVRSTFNHKDIGNKMKHTLDTNSIGHDMHNNNHNHSTNNIIMNGINQSQQFLQFISKHGNEKLFHMLEAQRNTTPYLYDKCEENNNEFTEPRKHPGKWTPKYAAKHYQTKCCIIEIHNKYSKRNIIITLRIDYIKSSMNGYLKYNGLWLFTVHQKMSNQSKQINNYQYYLNNCYDVKHITYSQECLTLNCAAKLFNKHLRFELYKNNAKMVFSQNTKFDAHFLMGDLQNNDDGENKNNHNAHNHCKKENDVFQIL